MFKRGGKDKRGGVWYISWIDHMGSRHVKSARTTDKATAERIANKLEAEASLRRDRVIDPEADEIGKESQRAIESHLEDYEARMRAAARTEKHIAGTLRHIRAIVEFAGFQTVGDISAEGVNRYAAMMSDVGRSARTINAHLSSIKALTRWLAENKKLVRDPLAAVKKPNPKSDRRCERRILLPDEWPWLIHATLEGPERFDMSPGERRLLYETAIQTGLRSGELRSLSRGNLVMDAHSAMIVCKARSTKNRKDARQHIHRDLADALKAHVARKAPAAPMFNLPHESRLAQMLRDDLAAARQNWLQAVLDDPDAYSQRESSTFLADVNDQGERLDFHSLRHTCGAWMALGGEHPKTIQTVLRHSSITLSMDTYGHLFPGQESAAVNKLHATMVGPSASLLATGTADDVAIRSSQSAAHAQRAGRETLPERASRCDASDPSRAQTKPPKSRPVADLSGVVRPDATAGTSSGGGTRTPDTRIMIPFSPFIALRQTCDSL